MHSTIHVAHCGHLSRHERQRLARAEAFSRRTLAALSDAAPVKLDDQALELIQWLVRKDRTAVSTALLVIAGIGAGEDIRRAVLSRVGEATKSARAAGAINQGRAGQIARHIGRAVAEADRRLAA
jgi:hypothetical protein